MSQTRTARINWRKRLLVIALSIGVVGAIDISTAAIVPGTRHLQVAVSGDTTKAHRLLLVFPGYAADCQAISTSFQVHLQSGEALVVLCYPNTDFTDAQIFNTVFPIVKRNEGAEIVALGGSMGGLAAMAFLSQLSHIQESNQAWNVKLILDTCPAGKSTLRAPIDAILNANWYPGGGVSSLAWAAAQAIPREDPARDSTSNEVAIRDGNSYHQWIGTPALAAQARYINDFRLSGHGFSQAPAHTVYVEAADADRDPLVNVRPSIDAWREVIPDLEVRVLNERRGEWHIPWTYRPKEIMTIIHEISD